MCIRDRVVGFGNSACEIAIDLYEQGARPSMAVRSPVNILPRDVLGIPILELSLAMSRLPPKFADTINAPLLRLLVGDITKLGLKKLPYGPLEQIQKTASIPVLDIGTIKHIREGHIRIHDDLDHIESRAVHFVDGKKEEFDVIVAGIGYYRDYPAIIDVDPSRFEDLASKNILEKMDYISADSGSRQQDKSVRSVWMRRKLQETSL